MIRAIAASVPAAAAVAFIVGCGGGAGDAQAPTAPTDGEGGSGAGGPPPPELVAELESLPLYPDAAPDDPLYPQGVSTGPDLRAWY